jgi:2-phosphosulfolactate phosphatase
MGWTRAVNFDSIALDADHSTPSDNERNVEDVKISVALTPNLLREPRGHAVAVVDVLRASTMLVTMFERGLLRAIVTNTINDARQQALRNFSLLCGEVKSLQPAGFDYGNSPSQIAAVDLKGKSAVVFTTNGTRAIAAARDAPALAIGSLRNRRACARKLLCEATRLNVDIAIVCAGNERGTAFSLEDTVAAGAIVEAIRDADATVAMTDESWAAFHLWRWYGGDALRALHQSAHGRTLEALGFEQDLRFAAELDSSECVPVLSREDEADVLRVSKASAASSTSEL